MLNFTKKWLFPSILGSLFALNAIAQHSDKDVKEDVAAAHEAAAKCLESGKKADACYKELQASCKGLAIGKYCGMKHEH